MLNVLYISRSGILPVFAIRSNTGGTGTAFFSIFATMPSGSMRGSIIAAVILTALPELLRGSFSDYRMLIYAILLIVMMLVNNNETMKMYTERFKGYLHLDGRAKASKTSKASAKEQEVS